MTKMAVQSAMEFRVSFLMQVFGMLLNNVGWVLVFYLFFQRFQNVNGWTFIDMQWLYAISMTGFGIFSVFMGGAHRIGLQITNGRLDYYLTYPKSPLWFLTVSRTDISAIGDFLSGILIFIFLLGFSWLNLLLLLVAAWMVAFIFWGFCVLVQSLTFWFGEFEAVATELFWMLVSLSLYPQSVFGGPVKLLLYLVLPALLIGQVPMDFIRKLDWTAPLMMLGAIAFFTITGVLVFRAGLKRYESGNIMINE